MTAPIRALRVHLGAHKTATTHLQKALHKHRDGARRRRHRLPAAVELRPALRAAAGWPTLPWGAPAGSAPRSTGCGPAPAPWRSPRRTCPARSATSSTGSPTATSRRGWRRSPASPGRRRWRCSLPSAPSTPSGPPPTPRRCATTPTIPTGSRGCAASPARGRRAGSTWSGGCAAPARRRRFASGATRTMRRTGGRRPRPTAGRLRRLLGGTSFSRHLSRSRPTSAGAVRRWAVAAARQCALGRARRGSPPPGGRGGQAVRVEPAGRPGAAMRPAARAVDVGVVAQRLGVGGGQRVSKGRMARRSASGASPARRASGASRVARWRRGPVEEVADLAGQVLLGDRQGAGAGPQPVDRGAEPAGGAPGGAGQPAAAERRAQLDRPQEVDAGGAERRRGAGEAPAAGGWWRSCARRDGPAARGRRGHAAAPART